MTRRSQLLDLLLNAPAYQAARTPYDDRHTADIEPFPFLAIVGQREMKLALMLAIINPLVGGVLLLGARGTAKTTAVRALIDLLPTVRRSLCPNGLDCSEDRVEEQGMDGICTDCATKFGYGEPLTEAEKSRIVELPLNSRLEDVIGGIDERQEIEHSRVRLSRGLLSQANKHVLYIDEVNLLDDAIIDAILDAAAQGHYTVWRGPVKQLTEARFLLVGSMNPEEGQLRPQIMDRFGLRAVARGLTDQSERYEAYERARQYRLNPPAMAGGYAEMTLVLADEINRARARLPQVTIGAAAQALGLELISQLGIESNRAEITLFEAARAYAAADERVEVLPADVAALAPLALRLRRSAQLETFFAEIAAEDERVMAAVKTVAAPAEVAAPGAAAEETAAEAADE